MGWRGSAWPSSSYAATAIGGCRAGGRDSGDRVALLCAAFSRSAMCSGTSRTVVCGPAKDRWRCSTPKRYRLSFGRGHWIVWCVDHARLWKFMLGPLGLDSMVFSLRPAKFSGRSNLALCAGTMQHGVRGPKMGGVSDSYALSPFLRQWPLDCVMRRSRTTVEFMLGPKGWTAWISRDPKKGCSN